jgi:lipoyl(octanoyl) transferase
MVEHDPVYTLGKNADENHLLQSRRDDVPTFTVERGGDVTFHGPGQIVGYPILDLHDHQLSINWYMRSLEEVLIRTLAEFRIDSERREGLTGVWVEDRKIASLGVRLSRWVTMHGFALNVTTDLSYFDGIIPCGIFECGVTSMERILGEKLVLEVVQKKIEQMFVNVFDLKVSERAGF